MRKIKSCGILLFRKRPHLEFLLMKHRHRHDLPKGHIEAGEQEEDCALRELEEETGIPQGLVTLEPGFRFTETYFPRYKRFGCETVEKTLVVFLGWLQSDVEVCVSEHEAHEWIKWSPPHTIQTNTIDPLLLEVQEYWD